jgi:hypothetical protein
MKGPLADQVSKPMSKLKGAAFERNKDISGMERKLIKMRADAGLAGAAAGGFVPRAMDVRGFSLLLLV